MLNRYDPFREAMSLRHAMDQLFVQSFVNPGLAAGSQAAFVPMDVFETDQGYQIRVAVPGYKPEDIELTLHNNTLTVKGQYQSSTGQDQNQAQDQTQNQNQGQQGNVLMQEIHSGSFERSITFARPIDSNGVQTQCEHGILTITAPISEASRPRRIPISGGSQSQGQQPSGQQSTGQATTGSAPEQTQG